MTDDLTARRTINDVYNDGTLDPKWYPEKILRAVCQRCHRPRGEHAALRPYAEGHRYDPTLDRHWCPEGEGFSTTGDYISP